MLRAIFSILFIVCYSLLNAQLSKNVVLLDNWQDTTILKSSLNGAYNEVWGFTQNDREYGVIGTTIGTHIFEITNDGKLMERARVPGRHQKRDAVHRDFHDYNGYLYAVCDEGPSTLQIIDLHNLPNSVEVVYDTNATFSRCHNIFIENGLLYVCTPVSSRGRKAFEVFSLDNPLKPELLYTYTGVFAVHDVYVRDNIAYLFCGTDGLFVMDFTVPDNPQLLGTMTQYPQKGYNHSGWLTHDGRYCVFMDENHGSPIKVADITDYSDIEVEATFFSNVASNSIAHNLIIRGNYAYVSHYHDGLYIFDLTDPLNPIETGYYDTSTLPHGGFKGSWGVYPLLPSGRVLLSDIQNGLFLFDVSQATDSLALDEVNVFPNPFIHNFSIGFPEDDDEVLIEVFDLTGQRVFAQTLTLAKGVYRVKVEGMESLLQGLYIMRIEGTKNSAVRKLLKTDG